MNHLEYAVGKHGYSCTYKVTFGASGMIVAVTNLAGKLIAEYWGFSERHEKRY